MVPQFRTGRICRGRSSDCDFLHLGARIYDMGIAHSLGCPTSSGVLTQGCFAHSGSWVALGESKVPPERFCTMWGLASLWLLSLRHVRSCNDMLTERDWDPDWERQ